MKRIARIGKHYEREFSDRTFEQIVKEAAEQYFQVHHAPRIVTVEVEDVDLHLFRLFEAERVSEWHVCGMRGGE